MVRRAAAAAGRPESDVVAPAESKVAEASPRAIVARLAIGFLLLVAIGIQGTKYVERQTIFAAVAVAIALLPGTGPAVARGLERIRHPSPRAAAIAALAVGVTATAYLIVTGIRQGRDLIPKFHDEHMYLLQMQMLARGRLWMRPHEVGDSFESFFVLTRPVYAPVYFPGTALMYVPTVWLKLPYWLLPAVVSGATVGLFYHVVTELLDGVDGALAAFLLVTLRWFRHLSLIVMSHTVALFLGVLMFWLLLRWRRRRHWGWLAGIGACAGWAAITRPIDAIAYALPVALVVMADVGREGFGRLAKVAAVVIVSALPFVALQMVFDVGVTGKPFYTPYQMYLDRDQPHTGYGFHALDPSAAPASRLPQKQEYYFGFCVPEIQRHRLDTLPSRWAYERLPRIGWVALSSTFLFILIPPGLFGLAEAGPQRSARRALAATLPLYLLLYVPFAFLLPHYLVLVAPAVILLALLGKRAVERTWPTSRRLPAALTLVVVGITAAFLPELNRAEVDDDIARPAMVFAAKQMPRLIDRPALVLFRYGPGADCHEEPVVNTSVAWPDDAEIVRAHDLGIERDRELIEYYARHQPGRHVYAADRTSGQMQYLGTAGNLAEAMRAAAPTSR